jgi:hypothetical protein
MASMSYPQRLRKLIKDYRLEIQIHAARYSDNIWKPAMFSDLLDGLDDRTKQGETDAEPSAKKLKKSWKDVYAIGRWDRETAIEIVGRAAAMESIRQTDFHAAKDPAKTLGIAIGEAAKYGSSYYGKREAALLAGQLAVKLVIKDEDPEDGLDVYINALDKVKIDDKATITHDEGLDRLPQKGALSIITA